jgi:hypothetical protein
MTYTREQIEALINTLGIQRHNLSETIKDSQNQLTMTEGAIQGLQHLLSLQDDENLTPNEAAKNGDDNNGINTANG